MTYRKRLTRWAWLSAGLVLLWGLTVGPTHAHEGPPFLIITDHDMGPFVVSVWADPDIGTGTFFVVLEPPEGGELPSDIDVAVGVRPISGRLDEAVYPASPQAVRYGARYYAEVEFDRGEMWHVRVSVESPDGGGTVTTEVEATPDGGIGPIGMVVFLLPFVAVGGLWLKAVLRKRQQKTDASE